MASSVPRICETCGKEFSVPRQRANAHFCSLQCYWDYGRVKRVCKQCGKTFVAEKNQVETGHALFCSRECVNEWQSEHVCGSAHPNWQGGPAKRVCKVCGTQFGVRRATVDKGGGQFCSVECAGKWRSKHLRGKKSPSWTGGPEHLVCEVCGKAFERYSSHIRKESHGKFCSSRCAGVWLSEHKRGANSPLWRGGRSPYPAGWIKTFKQAIRDRDGNKCLFCGKTTEQNGRALDVHHIDYDKTNLDEDNLVSLCRACHTRTGTHRAFWRFAFKMRNRPRIQDWQHRKVIGYG